MDELETFTKEDVERGFRADLERVGMTYDEWAEGGRDCSLRRAGRGSGCGCGIEDRRLRDWWFFFRDYLLTDG